MLKFYEEKIIEHIGRCKRIDINNFSKEFENYIKNNSAFINDIKSIILPKIDKTKQIVELIIKSKSINITTTDFGSAILIYLKEAFNKTLEENLNETENNNFFTTIFMLNIINNLEKEKSNMKTLKESKLNDYAYNISDDKLLKNKLDQFQ